MGLFPSKPSPRRWRPPNTNNAGYRNLTPNQARNLIRNLKQHERGFKVIQAGGRRMVQRYRNANKRRSR